MGIKLKPEIRPGQPRDETALQVYRQIETSLNSTGAFVDGEQVVPVVSGAYNVYTLSHAPLAGSLHLFDAGKRVAPSAYTVQGSRVTILTASIVGPTLFDYRY